MAACGSAKGLSRLLFDHAQTARWKLITAGYCIEEVDRNIGKLRGAATNWTNLIRPRLDLTRSEIVLDRPIIFDKTKDRPVIFSAIGARAHFLVTSDTTDFAHVLGISVYGVQVRTPRMFLIEMDVISAD